MAGLAPPSHPCRGMAGMAKVTQNRFMLGYVGHVRAGGGDMPFPCGLS
jgi:hypothetical protein